MPHLALYLTIALIAGLAAGVLTDVSSTLPLTLTLATAWAMALLALIRRRALVGLVAVSVSLVAAGWLLGAHAVERALHPPLRTLLEQRLGGFAIDASRDGRLDEPVQIEGRLVTDAAPTPTGAVMRVKVERVWLGECPEPAFGGVSLGVSGVLHGEHLAAWTAGRVIRAPALLRRPARYLNEGLPDLERLMARRGTSLVGSVKSAALVEVVSHGRWWEEVAASVRRRTRTAIARHIGQFDAQSAAIATAILIGDRTGLDPQVERRLQEAGTYHVIAISGGNIAILAGLVLGAMAWLGMRGRVAALVAIAVLTAYATVASGGASVARATLMAVLYLAVRAIDHRTAAANAIALTAAVMMLANPLAITDVGLWLTFGASAAILIGASQVAVEGASVKRAILTLLIASVCAELALAPVGATIFQRVTLAGLLLNFVAIPAMSVVQVASMAVAAFDLLPIDGLTSWIARVAHLGALALVESARLLDVAPWLTWRVPSPGYWVLLEYYASMTAWWRCPGRLARCRKAAALVTALLFVWIITAPPARIRAFGDGRLHVTLIDVGQGDALLVTFPNGRRLVVDTGGVTLRGEFDIGDRVIGPALRARGILSLDYLAVTHGDPDHIGGARSLVRDFAPAEVWWGVPVANHEPTKLLQGEATLQRAAWRTLQRGDRLEIAGVQIQVQHPPPPDWERPKVRNDDSLVLELRFGHVSVFLTGDIGREVEKELLPTLDPLPLVVMKVPHHGSGTSSSPEFIERLRPAVALIGVGRGNPYGHPLPYVLERYRKVGTEIFRTDQDGQAELVTDGNSIRVTTYTGRNVEMRHEEHEGRHEEHEGRHEEHEGRHEGHEEEKRQEQDRR